MLGLSTGIVVIIRLIPGSEEFASVGSALVELLRGSGVHGCAGAGALRHAGREHSDLRDDHGSVDLLWASSGGLRIAVAAYAPATCRPEAPRIDAWFSIQSPGAPGGAGSRAGGAWPGREWLEAAIDRPQRSAAAIARRRALSAGAQPPTTVTERHPATILHVLAADTELKP